MVQDLAIFSLTLAVVFLLAVAFYESLSRRDVLVAGATRLAKRLTNSRIVGGATYFVTVFALVPVLVAVWAIVLEAALAVVGTPNPLSSAESAVAIVAAARLLAYVREKTAHELAKLIPLALALSLLVGGLVQFEENISVIVDGEYRSDLTIELVAYLVVLEIALRLTNDVIRKVVTWLRMRRSRSVAPDGGDQPPGSG